MTKRTVAKNKSGHSTTKELQRLITRCRPVLVHHQVKKAGIFGSYARGEQTSKSDVDILVQLKKGEGYFALVGLELELRKVLEMGVDLVPYDGLHPLLKKKILQDEVRIL